MTTFTLIAYRPNGSDYQGGYCQATSDSALLITEHKCIEDLVKGTLPFYFEYKNTDYEYEYEEWELTVLINGREEFYDEDSDYLEHSDLIQEYKTKLKEDIKVKYELIKKQQIEAEEKRKRSQIQANIEANIRAKKYQEEQKLATYRRLKEKYENKN